MRYILAGRRREFDEWLKKQPPETEAVCVSSARVVMGEPCEDIECIGSWQKRPDIQSVRQELQRNKKRNAEWKRLDAAIQAEHNAPHETHLPRPV